MIPTDCFLGGCGTKCAATFSGMQPALDVGMYDNHKSQRYSIEQSRLSFSDGRREPKRITTDLT